MNSTDYITYMWLKGKPCNKNKIAELARNIIHIKTEDDYGKD